MPTRTRTPGVTNGLLRWGSGAFGVVRLVGGPCVAGRGRRSWTVPPIPRKRVWGRLHRGFKSHRHRQTEHNSAPPRFLSLIHISEPTRQAEISYAVFCLKKKK